MSILAKSSAAKQTTSFSTRLTAMGAEHEAKRQQKYADLKAERFERLSNRNIDKEPFLGQEPVPEAFALAIKDLLKNEADKALLFHIYMKWMRQYKDEIQPVFCDYEYRRNKVVKGKKILEPSNFKRIIDSGLLRMVKKGHLGYTADLYEPTEMLNLLYVESSPKTYQDFLDLRLVNPLTGRLCRRPEHQLKGAPEGVIELAKKCAGVQIDLMAIYKLHREEYDRWEYAMQKHPRDRTKQEEKGVGRYLSNNYNLLGIRINGFTQLPGGDVILNQAWGFTYTSRLKPLKGGLLNLSRDYREVGLSNCLKIQWVHDLVAAQINILLEMADERGIKLPQLENYAADKSMRDYYAQLIGYGCTGKTIKTVVLSLAMSAATPNPKVVERLMGSPGGRQMLGCYSFAETFLEAGGLDCYKAAYRVLEPIIKETRLMAKTLYKESLLNASKYKEELWVQNAAGSKQAFWDKTGKPTGGRTKSKVERQLMAFYLQGREQQIIQEISKQVNILGYEHDGFISETKVIWEKGRIRIEGEARSYLLGRKPQDQATEREDESEGRESREEKTKGETTLHTVTDTNQYNPGTAVVSADSDRGTAFQNPVYASPRTSRFRRLTLAEIHDLSCRAASRRLEQVSI